MYFSSFNFKVKIMCKFASKFRIEATLSVGLVIWHLPPHSATEDLLHWEHRV